MVDNQAYLTQKAYEGLSRRGLSDKPEYKERLEHELSIIASGQLADFILDTAFICVKLKIQGIQLGVGRGSAAGSLLCYCMRITEIDPLEYGLIFERFLNPTRINSISSADIDTDIPRDKRQQVLKQVKEDFGQHQTAQVINKLKWTKKTAIKDLARIIDVPFNEVNRVTGLIASDEDIDNDIVQNFLNKYPFIKENYLNITDLIKNYSIHAGGVIILPGNIENYASLLKVNKVDAICYDGKTCDSIGFLKQDLLGINTLTIIADCLKLNTNIVLPTSNFNDDKVYKNINQSQLGIFQLESEGASHLTQQLIPEDFNDLCAVVALCRPGPKDSGDTDMYVACKHGQAVEYDHPALEPILKQNYGAIIYQEDIMRIVTDWAGLTSVDADNIRRGVGKKIQAVFDEYHPKFINACVNNNIPEETAEIVWNKIEKSGSYSFNKSHCVSYSVLSYLTGYLKTYYPIEFYLAMLNNTESEDKRMRIYNEMKNIDKNIKNPDINKSKDVMVSDNNDIYLSLSLIKGVGVKAIEDIVNKQPFDSFNDFLMRKDSRKVNKRVVKALIESGAFDEFNSNRGELMHQVDEGEPVDWTEEDTLFREFGRLKINPKGNVLELYDISDYDIKLCSIATLKKIKHVKTAWIKVMISELKVRDDYGFLSVTDNFDNLSMFISKQAINRYTDIIHEVGYPILVKLTVNNGKYTFCSCLDLKNPQRYPGELRAIDGSGKQQLLELQKNNPNINVGLIYNLSCFKSKQGNECCKYDIFVSDELILEERLTCNSPFKMSEGSFIFFFPSNEPFIQLKQVI